VENLRSKLSSVGRFDEMLEATHKLRLQQDEQVKLQDRLKEQKSQLLHAEHRLHGLNERLNDERRNESAASTNPKALLDKLDREVGELEKQVMEMLPQQINEKQRRMNELQAVLGTEPATSDGELQALQAQHHQLQRVVKELEERKRATLSNPDDKLAMFRQQANLVAKKKDALEQRLASVAEQRAAVEAELADKGAALKTTAPVPKGEDLRKYGLEIRGKMAVFKRMKAELSELRSEWGIISRTQGLLREQENKLAARLGEAEARRGVEGYGATQEELEKVSQQKAEVDEIKGKTLDEMSVVVGEINEKIKQRKHQLAPQIMKLRKLRSEVRDKETVYLEKKQKYDTTKAGIESNLAKVQAEADEAIKTAAHEESSACYYESAASIERVKLQRAADEKAGRFQRTLPDGTVIKSYRDLYMHKVKQQEAASKELRERQKRIKDNHGGNAKQVQIFKSLHKLLRCKIDAQQRARAEANDMMQAEKQDTNIFTMPEGNEEGGGYSELN